MPKAALGTPAAGWGFTVVLTGQDGFSPDQARGSSRPRRTSSSASARRASTDPHCGVQPGHGAQGVDVFTPAGTAQSDELDYTLHNPVTIAPVVMP